MGKNQIKQRAGVAKGKILKETYSSAMCTDDDKG